MDLLWTLYVAILTVSSGKPLVEDKGDTASFVTTSIEMRKLLSGSGEAEWQDGSRAMGIHQKHRLPILLKKQGPTTFPSALSKARTLGFCRTPGGWYDIDHLWSGLESTAEVRIVSASEGNSAGISHVKVPAQEQAEGREAPSACEGWAHI